MSTVLPSPALREIPGDPGLPVVGHTFGFMHNPVRFLGERYRRYGEVSWSNAFGIRMVSMLGPDANQFVLRNQGDWFSNHQGWDYFIGKFFTRGIMLLDFEEHRYHRSIMQAAFKKPVLVRYLGHMNPMIERGIGAWQPSPRFQMFRHLKQLTLDMATEIFVGAKLGREADRLNQAFIDTVKAGTALVRHPVPGLRWKKGLDGRRVLEDYFRAGIAAKRARETDDLFSVLCHARAETGESFTDDDVVNHMIFLLMAAHDTSTITLCSIFNRLAQNPEWQERVRAESFALGKRHLDYDDLERLEAMGLVMKEALRMMSPVPSIPRKTVKDVQYKDFLIPRGTFINVVPYYTHYMEEWWENPQQFDPLRFSEPRNEHKKHMYQYVPFGGGAHMCIGLHFAEVQIKAILHQVVQRYRWRVKPGYDMPVDNTSLPVPADGLPVHFERL
ncbi:MAG: cytochrome P450 [Moraxellaceae bacterium]